MHVAVVTGASSGIGQAAAELIAASGMGVVVTYRNRQEGAADTVTRIEAAGGSAVALRLDLADSASIADFSVELVRVLTEKWQTDRLQALVNNAGIGGGMAFEEIAEEMLDGFYDALFKGPFLLTQRLLPLLADGATIVNTGSTSALPTGTTAGYSGYAAQKGAVHTLTRCWAAEFAHRGIRVNAVAPGSTRTRIAGDAFASLSADELAGIAHTVALGRVGEPDDIGRVIAFLAGPDSAWITGEIIECSGGQGL